MAELSPDQAERVIALLSLARDLKIQDTPINDEMMAAFDSFIYDEDIDLKTIEAWLIRKVLGIGERLS